MTTNTKRAVLNQEQAEILYNALVIASSQDTSIQSCFAADKLEALSLKLFKAIPPKHKKASIRKEFKP
jgi:hypothetical protein